MAQGMEELFGYGEPIRLGIAGGLGTPEAVASAYALGAHYVLLGSVHQSTVESGLSTEGKRMLAAADINDIAMAPAADMFELGVKVQVLNKGTVFPLKAQKLYNLYRKFDRMEAIPKNIVHQLEKNIFHDSLSEIWKKTSAYHESLNKRRELDRATKEPHYKMGLTFKWYLGNSSQWALRGEKSRMMDYQIWCGPSMGAFNSWVKGSFLEEPGQRYISQVALNLLEGAAYLTRIQQLRAFGVFHQLIKESFQPRLLSV